MSSLQLSPMTAAEQAAIAAWPAYEGRHARMDYALRRGGWLDSSARQAGTRCYAAHVDGLQVGFSLLIPQTPHASEFRLAVHPAQLGKGYGNAITGQTLALAFARPELEALNLIVRKDNTQARRLYENHGFRLCGEQREVIQGQSVEFYAMCLLRNDKQRRTRQ